MKANEVPERIYCTPTEGGFYLTTIKPEPPFAEGVEYSCTDAFIEKSLKYIANHFLVPGMDNEIKDFINYMKGE